MIVYFDKGLSSQSQLELDYFNEDLIEKHASGSLNRSVTETTIFPEVEKINREFSTVEIYNKNGIKIPIINRYNYIANLIVNYDESAQMYGLSLTLIYKTT